VEFLDWRRAKYTIDFNRMLSSDTALFDSPPAAKLKREICEMGRRIWMREYCDANGGNISARLAPDRFLVTPTNVSKGFMTPDMIVMVDGKGQHVAGTWQSSSEFLTHLAIYDVVPEALSVCHAHPCHAGAFAIKGFTPPSRLIPELEIFVGQIVVAPYETPGSPGMAAKISPLAPKHQSILMACHGTLCWGNSVEDAYFKMEITDAYCRTVLLARGIPGGAAIAGDKMLDLLDRKRKAGLPDTRFGLPPGELAKDDPWKHMGESDLDALAGKLADEIVARLRKA
jgi:L-fuculose-phosphate aldolase